MEILGVGTDIIEIERIKEAVDANPQFSSRVYTDTELDYCSQKRNCYPHLAARFAAKEAVAKAIGRSLSWQDVEIVSSGSDQPEAVLKGRASEVASGCRVMLTMSHSRHYATATALLVRDDR